MTWATFFAAATVAGVFFHAFTGIEPVVCAMGGACVGVMAVA